jgi:hypothetical protein
VRSMGLLRDGRPGADAVHRLDRTEFDQAQ